MPLEIEKLTGGYGEQAIARDIDLVVESGEWLTLIGANGSGKSTLLKLISRILAPQQGSVLLNGKEIHTQPPAIVAQKLAILPQQQTIPEGLTVRQLVSLGRAPHQPWWQWELSQEDAQKVQMVLGQTNLEKFSDRPVEQLSGGERQRAFLALALAQNPQVLLLDEPTTFLDISYQLQLLELLKYFNQHHKLTLIIVLHEINLAARYSDRIALLNKGKLSGLGTPRQVLTPDNLAETFGVQVTLLETPVGLQICPLASTLEHQGQF